MPDPERTVARLAAAVRPGGWLLIEEADFSMFRASDAHYPGADAFDRSVRRLLDGIRSAGIWDGCLGHRIPLFAERLGFERTGLDCVPFMARGGDDPGGRFWSLTFPLSSPQLVADGDVDQTDLDHVQTCLADPEFRFIAGVLFGAWARRG